ncbi:hypothetical protein [Flexivirga caeni]|uniref:Uncharacterized protein n=1 Tax=Flexivirga caeni TaxID=2294115 RepID=A0A3M9MF67_9MICO|nr:hypothetical protein [Flexivirga caeni]RNI23288.1 hypothetical protein EFY87_07640 [Flexivirga caeni]
MTQPPSGPYGQQPAYNPQPYPGQQPQPPYGQQPPYNPQPYPGQQRPGEFQFGQPYAFQKPTKVPLSSGARTIGWLTALAALLAIAGCFAPWATIDLGILGHVSVNGFGQVSGAVHESPDEVKDGAVVMSMAIIVIVLAVLRGLGKTPRAAAVVALVLGLLCLLTTGYDFNDISGDTSGAQVGWGLWLALVASIVMSVLGVVGIVKRR